MLWAYASYGQSYRELRLLCTTCAGDEDWSCDLSREQELFDAELCTIGLRYQRFTVLMGVRAFARQWLRRLHANAAE